MKIFACCRKELLHEHFTTFTILFSNVTANIFLYRGVV